MEVKMNKEIRDYQESMFMGLDLRQCVCSVLAILTAIGIYFGMREITGQEITGWLCVLGAAPFAACGFFKYHGMTAEQFLWAVIKSELLYPKKLVFQSEDIHYSCMQETISLGEKNQKDGAEIIKEREQRAEASKFRNQSNRQFPSSESGRMEFFNRERNSQKHIVLQISTIILRVRTIRKKCFWIIPNS